MQTRGKVASTLAGAVIGAPVTYIVQRALGAWGVLDDIADALGKYLKLHVSPSAAGWTLALLLVLGLYGVLLWLVWHKRRSEYATVPRVHQSSIPNDIMPPTVVVPPTSAPTQTSNLSDEEVRRLTGVADRIEREDRAKQITDIIRQLDHIDLPYPTAAFNDPMAQHRYTRRALVQIGQQVAQLVGPERLQKRQDQIVADIEGNAINCTLHGEEHIWQSPEEKQQWIVRQKIMALYRRTLTNLESIRDGGQVI